MSEGKGGGVTWLDLKIWLNPLQMRRFHCFQAAKVKLSNCHDGQVSFKPKTWGLKGKKKMGEGSGGFIFGILTLFCFLGCLSLVLMAQSSLLSFWKYPVPSFWKSDSQVVISYRNDLLACMTTSWNMQRYDFPREYVNLDKGSLSKKKLLRESPRIYRLCFSGRGSYPTSDTISSQCL